MGIQHFSQQFFGPGAFVDKATGILTVNASKFLLALFNRTGAGTGIVPKVDDVLVAAGADISTALGLVKDWNLITSGAANTGVQISPLLMLQPGNDIQVYNNSGSAKNVYPPDGQTQIDSLAPGAPFSLADKRLRVFEMWTPTLFVSYGN